MNVGPIEELRDPGTPGPTAVDERGRSAQIFVVDVLARRGSEARRVTARGQDIYAITAPIVVEALVLVTWWALRDRIARPIGRLFRRS